MQCLYVDDSSSQRCKKAPPSAQMGATHGKMDSNSQTGD